MKTAYRTVVLLTVGMLAAAGASAPAGAEAGAEAGPITTLAAASATIGGYPVWAHFSRPVSGPDYSIHNELIRLIDATPVGATIRAAIHSLSIDSVAQAFVRAQDRGVNVLAVIDGKNEASTDGAVVTIKRLTNRVFCQNSSGGKGCISTSADGDMHTKMVTFTATVDPNGVARSNVSWFGSPNLTEHSGPNMYNNAITVYGDATLMNGLNANFGDMWNRRHYSGNNYYDADSGRGYYQAAAADVYASPEGAGETDTINTRLNDITPDANCRLRVGMANVTTGRPKLVALLKNFEAAGCKVWMTVGTDAEGGISMAQSVYNELLTAGVSIRRKPAVHDKFFLAYGKFGTVYQYRVYTGSQNWTQDALNENDEIFVKMGPESGSVHPLYNAYYAHFVGMYDTGVACTKSNYPCK